MTKHQYLLPLFLLFCTATVFGQNLEINGEVNLHGFLSNKDELPFWMYANTRGRIVEDSDLAGWGGLTARYKLSESAGFEAGGAVLYSNRLWDEVSVDEAYLKFYNDWLEVVGGRKQKEELYRGLSATNESFAWSLNARPLPGIQVKIARPIYLNEANTFGFEASWNEYFMGKERFVKDTRLHHKSFFLVYKNDLWHFKAGIQHFAQWAGDSPKSGKQPSNLKDYIRVVTGRGGGESAVEGDRINALGNHLGTYELYITRKFKDFKLKFIYNHFFEDGSGTRFANFPDGRYGLFLDHKEDNRLVNGLLYEFYYTRNQSKNSTSPHKNDNYFDNRVTYNSGWTYQGNIIGVPFFDYDSENFRMPGNKFIAHHFGISGNLNQRSVTLPYKLLFSYIHKDGNLVKDYTPHRKIFAGMLSLGLWRDFVDIDLNLATELKNIDSARYGIGLKLGKRF